MLDLFDPRFYVLVLVGLFVLLLLVLFMFFMFPKVNLLSCIYVRCYPFGLSNAPQFFWKTKVIRNTSFIYQRISSGKTYVQFSEESYPTRWTIPIRPDRISRRTPDLIPQLY